MTSPEVVPAGPAGPAALDPPYDYPGYHSTRLRAPKLELRPMPPGMADQRGPVFGDGLVATEDHDLTLGHPGEPVGQRIIVTGRLRDSAGRPVCRQLVEIWQANAAGRYRHEVDRHPAPLDPNFTGVGRCLTDDDGNYRFVTVSPGPTPGRTMTTPGGRPTSTSPSSAQVLRSRLVTQMYFPDDPLLALDPIYQSIRDRRAAELLVARFDMATTVESWALGYTFDIVVGGAAPTPVEA